MFIKQRKHQGK